VKKFTDAKGRVWYVAINVTAARIVRDLTGVNLYQAISDNFAIYTKVVGDPVLLTDVLYCLCKEQADTWQITDEEFGRGMAGDVLVSARDAFTEELIDFFPDGQLRAMIRATLAKAKELQQAMLFKATSTAANLDASALATSLSGEPTASPELSASTQGRSRSGNWFGWRKAVTWLRGTRRR
jgi:hypothetical protein